MSQLGSRTLASPHAAGLTDAGEAEERLPLRQTVLLLGAFSAVLWLAIAGAARWLLA